jgi:hypothetical protein
MSRGKTRRNVLRGAGILGLGAAAAGGLSANAEASTPATPSPWPARTGRKIATVKRVTDGAVLVERDSTWYQLEGFPAGWQVTPGDSVAIAPSVETGTLVARPFSHWVRVTAAPAGLRPGSGIGGAGPQMMDQTVIESGLRTAGGTPRTLLVAVEDGKAEVRALAVREK